LTAPENKEASRFVATQSHEKEVSMNNVNSLSHRSRINRSGKSSICKWS